eukprot:jgi/Botrbrau1/13379/Bobra.0194s0011.1
MLLLAGEWYRMVPQDAGRASKCFRRALALDPKQELAGNGLIRLLREGGAPDRAIALCREVTSREAGALWAHAGLGFMLLASGEGEAAIPCFQSALRGDPFKARIWEGLGAAYQSQGRITAALKAYTKASELDGGRGYPLLQAGALQLSLGLLEEATQSYEAALKLAPSNPTALLGSAQAAFAVATRSANIGILGTAVKSLWVAEDRALACTAAHPNLATAWKQLGDIRLMWHSVAPPSEPPTSTSSPRRARA